MVLIAVGIVAALGILGYLLHVFVGAATARRGVLSPGPGATLPPGSGITEIVDVSSPVHRGQVATIRALAHPGAKCTLTATDPGGSPVNTGTGVMTAGAQGVLSWAWRLGSQVLPGSYRLVVSCRPGTTSTSTLVVV